MAGAVVVLVLGKLANIINKEMKYLGGVGEKIKRMQRELTRIKCCLIDADLKRKRDARVQNWLNELRDVAYRIEDAIDIFFVEHEDIHHQHQNPSFLQQVVKKLRSKPPKMYILHNLGTELDNIQNQLKEISQSRVDYGIIALQDIVGEEVIMTIRRATYQEVDETEVVGLQADKNNILKLLRPEETPRLTIITIVGTGGIGKTTLAHMVYKSARADFEYHIILSISQTFSLAGLLRKMLLLLKNSVPKDQDVEDLINELKSFLSSRRYLIILDDVWNDDLWNQLKNALPDVKNGSRVLMTSRLIDIAKSADSKITPYELSFLDNGKSLELLLKKALHYQEPNNECPSGLLELADKLSKKCKGLPLALIVVGGILSIKERDYHVWERVLLTMDWHSDGMGCIDVLAMSYHDMPYHLKACFLYLASFPEDKEISAKRLIRIWVAEGFIPHERTKTLEETAEKYLEELSRRSMIQVTSRSPYGWIKSCKVHDLLRDFAMHEAGQENFVTVFSPEKNVNQPSTRIRRVSLQYSLKIDHRTQQQSMGYGDPTTRSILTFEFVMPLPNYSNNFRLLKVLLLECCGRYSDNLLVEGLDELVHLKYLGIRNCEMQFVKCSFHRMKAFETLEIRGCTKLVSDDTLWTIETLRHVRCDYGFFGPPSTANLRNLQTLRGVRTLKTWDRNLPNLNNLRKLYLSRELFDHWVIVTNLLQVLPYLVSLTICGFNMPMEIVYPKALPNYQNLQSLCLRGDWSKTVTLEASSFPPNLGKLTLYSSLLKQNPMPELGKLKNLKKLSLLNMCFAYNSPTICPTGFSVLWYLKVNDVYSLKDFTVAEGVMPKLAHIVVSRSLNLQLPPELQHATIHYSF